MVSLNVMLGAVGAAGFTFGLVRTRLAENRGQRDPADPADLGEHAPGPVTEVADEA